jgi:methionine--tRNA ligase beta chain
MTAFEPAVIKPNITPDDLDKIDVRVGTIELVEDVPDSDKLVKLRVNFGDRERSILVGMKKERENPKGEIEGKQTLFIVNLEPGRMAGQISEGMLFDIGFPDGISPVLARPEKPVPNGSRAGSSQTPQTFAPAFILWSSAAAWAENLAMSDPIVLRRAVAADASAIRALTRNAYAKWVPMIGREPLPMTANYTEAMEKHRIDLLYLGGVLVALIQMIPEIDHLLIENVAVYPKYQGRGFGRYLMAHAEQVVASLGHSEIRLYTNKLFAENVVLYKKLGYQVDWEESWTGGVVVHMSKSIPSKGEISNAWIGGY